jgi:deoxycytidylate deaminase
MGNSTPGGVGSATAAPAAGANDAPPARMMGGAGCGGGGPPRPNVLPAMEDLNLYGWKWNPELTVDENYMDLCFLATRNSICKEGKVGCVLVKGIEDGKSKRGALETGPDHVVYIATNTPLLRLEGKGSDCHAEANIVCWCARHGIPLAGCSVYVTIPPCKSCYSLLAMAGIGRIASRLHELLHEDKRIPPGVLANASQCGITFIHVPDTEERSKLRDELGTKHEDYSRVEQLRAERKRLRAKEKEVKLKNRKARMEAAKATDMNH